MAAYGKNYTTAGSAMGRRKPDAFDEEIFGQPGRNSPPGSAWAGWRESPQGQKDRVVQNAVDSGTIHQPAQQQDSGPPQTDDFTGDWQSDWQAYLASLGTQLTPRDTASEEALIQQNFEGLLGQGTNALAAQMGAAGFGQSGALMQAGSDLQGQLARQAAGQVNDVRRSAQQDYLNQLGLIGQMLMGGEQTGMSSEWYGNLMDMIQAELNQPESGPGSGQGDGPPEAPDPVSDYGSEVGWDRRLLNFFGFRDTGDEGFGTQVGSKDELPPGANAIAGPPKQLGGGWVREYYWDPNDTSYPRKIYYVDLPPAGGK